MDRFFATGSPVLFRNLAVDRVRYVEPSIVVTDSREERVLFRPSGTPIKVPGSFALRGDAGAREGASRRELLARDWDLVDAAWEGTDVLVAARPSDWFSVWMTWTAPSHDFLGFYVNFEVPWARTPMGFDTTDLCLDLVVHPDLSLHWKDRAAFESRVADGVITAQHAAEVRRAIDIVLKRIAARDGPFAGDDIHWRPDPRWRMPTIGEGWERLQ